MVGATSLRSAEKANGKTAADGLGIPESGSILAIQEKREQWRGAINRFNACEERIKRIREKRDKPQVSIEEQAQASLRGETRPASNKDREDLADLYREREVLGAAVNMATASRDEAIDTASLEVCKRLLPEHRSRVKEIARRAIALEEAVEAEAELRQAIQAKGFKVTYPMAEPLGLPITLGSLGNPNSPLSFFLKALRAKGLEV
jgi:DNA repair ATPase RecN